MPITLDGTNGITQADQFNSDSTFGFKNRIINGAMVIDQRNAGASVSVDGTAPYTLDRWQAVDSSDGVFSVQRDTVVPTGFVNSLKVTTTTEDSSLSASQFANLLYKIEGNNVSDLGWGTANAKTVTLSFWVRSSLTGTFAGSIRNDAGARSYVFNYTISSADTWEYKTITIEGDTSGTWETGISTGLLLTWSFGAGSNFDATAGSWSAGSFFNTSGAVSVIGTLNATWFVTGVQLEVGSTATSFDYRSIGTELALCQRYFERSYDIGTATATVTTAGANWTYINFASGSVNDFSTQLTFQASKRAIPTMTVYSPDTGASGNIGSVGGDKTATASYIGMHGCTIYGNLAGQSNAQCRAHWLASSEL